MFCSKVQHAPSKNFGGKPFVCCVVFSVDLAFIDRQKALLLLLYSLKAATGLDFVAGRDVAFCGKCKS